MTLSHKLLVVVSWLTIQAYGLKMYPFGGVDVHERADDILDKLRADLTLSVFQDTISKTLGSINGPSSLYIKNSEGIVFNAQKQKNEIKPAVNITGNELYDPVALGNSLEGTCAVLSVDYWNYEWCHRKQVSQFHMEQQGNIFTKSPEWSLGKYQRSVFVRENQRNESTPILKVIDYYKGGQHCDENNEHRSTEIHIQCCERTHMKNFISVETYYKELEKPRNSNPSLNGPPLPKATLNAIDEPNVCAYKAIVCTPLLCKRPDADSSSLSTTSTSGSLTEIMKNLNGTCLLRQEVWWTYELCFGKGIRQLRLNIEQTVLPDGNVAQKQVLASQFILGNPQMEVSTNETALIERTNRWFAASPDDKKQPQREEISAKEMEIIASSGLVSPLFKARGKEPKFLTLEYDNGTACDLHNMNRSVIVELYCGLSNGILSINEDSTCHYRMKVEVTALCTLPDFLPKKDNITSVLIVPVNSHHVGNNEEVEIDETTENNAEVVSDLDHIESVHSDIGQEDSSVEADTVYFDPVAEVTPVTENPEVIAVVNENGEVVNIENLIEEFTSTIDRLQFDSGAVSEPPAPPQQHQRESIHWLTEIQPFIDGENIKILTYKFLIAGLSILIEISETDSIYITRDEYIQSGFVGLGMLSAKDQLALLKESIHEVPARVLTAIQSVIDFDSLVHIIESLPSVPNGSDSFYLDKMSCVGPPLASIPKHMDDVFDAAYEDKFYTIYEEWIGCLHNEENLLITIEAMFTFLQMLHELQVKASMEL